MYHVLKMVRLSGVNPVGIIGVGEALKTRDEWGWEVGTVAKRRSPGGMPSRYAGDGTSTLALFALRSRMGGKGSAVAGGGANGELAGAAGSGDGGLIVEMGVRNGVKWGACRDRFFGAVHRSRRGLVFCDTS